MNALAKVVLTFLLAGFVSSWAYHSYSNWVESLYSANSTRHLQMESYNPSGAFQMWYAQNVRLTKYADRQWFILCLGFPLGLTLATFVSMGAGWLPGLSFQKALPALLPTYFAPAIVFFVSAISYMILLPVGMIFAAFVLVSSVKLATSCKPDRLLRNLLIAGTGAIVLLFFLFSRQKSTVSDAGPANAFLYVVECSWAALYGRSLARPAPPTPLQVTHPGLQTQ
jgi:hypothetical protein